jgi:dGTPase
VAAASLAHDLGNPPFGHAGEDSISDFFLQGEKGRDFKNVVTETQWQDLIRFEGNAQGFRILDLDQYGLKLTYASLGAFTKYPCSAFFPGRDKSKKVRRNLASFNLKKNRSQRSLTTLS